MKEIRVKKKSFNSIDSFRNKCGCLCTCGYETPYEASYRRVFQKAFDKNVTPWSTNK